MDESPLKQKLPAEVLLMVLDELCPQLVQVQCGICVIAKCTCGDGGPKSTVDPELVKSVQALAALNRTCREMHQLTTGLLYACPLFMSGKRWWFLARTLVTRPDLAGQVATLVLSENEGRLTPPFLVSKKGSIQKRPPEVQQEVMAYVRKRVESRPRPVTRYRTRRQRELDQSDMLNINRRPYRTPIDLILSLCPNVERLCVYGLVDEVWVGTFLPNGTTFPALKTVGIHDQDLPLPDRPHQFLRALAPHVETIYLDQPCHLYEGRVPPDLPVVLEKVKYLGMRTENNELEILAKNLELVPNVQELVVNAGIGKSLLPAKAGIHGPVDSSVTPLKAAEAFKTRPSTGPGSKLRKLTLNYTADLDYTLKFPPLDFSDPNRPRVLSGSLLGGEPNYDAISPSINFMKRRDRKFQDEVAQATETLAQMEIEFECTFPPDDWTEALGSRLRALLTSNMFYSHFKVRWVAGWIEQSDYS